MVTRYSGTLLLFFFLLMCIFDMKGCMTACDVTAICSALSGIVLVASVIATICKKGAMAVFGYDGSKEEVFRNVLMFLYFIVLTAVLYGMENPCMWVIYVLTALCAISAILSIVKNRSAKKQE